MTELRALLSDTTEKVLANLSADTDEAWKQVGESGLANVMVPEAEG